MKIALVDTGHSGHHKYYSKALVEAALKKGIEVVLLSPYADSFQRSENLNIFKVSFPERKSIFQYFRDRIKWQNQIWDLIANEQIDLMHILTADPLVNLGGMKLKFIKKTGVKILTTLHHSPTNPVKSFLFRQHAKRTDAIVCHSETFISKMKKEGISNCLLVDYPIFHPRIFPKESARADLTLPHVEPIVLYLGETRKSKGLDILLESMKMVNKDCILVIAGKEKGFDLNYIQGLASRLKQKVIIRLGWITDENFGKYVDACDCLILPYRLTFDGASGPMTEAIWRDKFIIGPDHGTIGYMIRTYELGDCFISEDISDLARAIESFLGEFNTKVKVRNTDSNRFKGRIEPEYFVNKYLEIYSTLLKK